MTKRIQDETAAQPFGFKRADQISPQLLQTLNAINERFARDVTAALSAYLRMEVAVTLLVTTQSTHADFMATAAEPTCASTLAIAPADKLGILEVFPEATLSLIDRLLGGEGRPVPNLRPLTEIEKGIMQGPLKIFADELGKAWKQTAALSFKVLETQTQLAAVQGIPSGEMVTVIEFQFRMSEEGSRIRLAIPSQTVEAVLRTGKQDVAGRTKQIHNEALISQVRRIPISLSIETPETHFPMESIISLQAGDTLLLDQRDEWPVLLKVEGKTKLQAQWRKDTKRKAFTVIARHKTGQEEHHELSRAQ